MSEHLLRNVAAVVVAILLLTTSACAQNGLEQADGELRLIEAFPNLSFNRPVDFQIPGDGSDRIFVLEQPGVIRVFERRSDVGTADEFLDIRDRVRDNGNEEGLLGLAFHANFSENGYFYVDYTASDPRRTVIARYQVDPQDESRALRDSEEVILEVEQPYGNHNGGQIAFGPDGYLYITLGDGGSRDDPHGHGQDRTTLLGALLRIDVDGGMPYAIPPDNPFADNDEGYREEIFAYGLRNAWRFSFDEQADRIWAADVGQNAYEEVDVIENGGNYGWNTMEGFHCFEPSSGCDESGLEVPVWEYSHDLGSSITGGFVYRGEEAPSLVGRYVFADFVSGRIWALSYDGGDADVEEIMDTSLAISSFGVDQNDELYALAFDGNIYRFTSVDEAD